MKFLIGSDIHTEFKKLKIPDLPDASEYDAVILPGDIGLGFNGLAWADSFFPADKKIYFVPGNHEYYKYDYEQLTAQFKNFDNSRISILNPGVAELDNCILIGATLWSSLKFADEQDISWIAASSIADFHIINGWSTSIHRQTYESEVDFICEQLATYQQSGKKLIVITHFLPTRQAVHPKYARSTLNAYFSNELDWVMDKFNPYAWIFGHTHDAYNALHPSGTMLICNPFGYPGENPSEQIKWKVFNVD